jgi:hypothetical protein
MITTPQYFPQTDTSQVLNTLWLLFLPAMKFRAKINNGYFESTAVHTTLLQDYLGIVYEVSMMCLNGLRGPQYEVNDIRQ